MGPSVRATRREAIGRRARRVRRRRAAREGIRGRGTRGDQDGDGTHGDATVVKRRAGRRRITRRGAAIQSASVVARYTAFFFDVKVRVSSTRPRANPGGIAPDGRDELPPSRTRPPSPRRRLSPLLYVVVVLIISSSPAIRSARGALRPGPLRGASPLPGEGGPTDASIYHVRATYGVSSTASGGDRRLSRPRRASHPGERPGDGRGFLPRPDPPRWEVRDPRRALRPARRNHAKHREGLRRRRVRVRPHGEISARGGGDDRANLE